MECPYCGSTNVSKLYGQDENFLSKTYKCVNGHTFDKISKEAKQTGLALLGGLLIAILTGNSDS